MSKRMTKDEVPRSAGVFKPVGHAVMVMKDAEAADHAIAALQQAGFGLPDTLVYSSEEMIAQCEDDIRQAGALASLGSEINLSRKHLELARRGCCFIIVFAPDDDRVQRVADIAERTDALFAQHYGLLAVEELIRTPESPRA
ncbi:MAG: hypothetical protein QM674_11625 [Burkholderiaceae bacterium]